MKKAIIKWLFGADWEEYWDLHEKYVYELEQHKKSIESEIEALEDVQKLRRMLLKEIDDELRTSNLALKVIDINEELERICKEHGIDTNKNCEKPNLYDHELEVNIIG